MITPVKFVLDVLYRNLYKTEDAGGGVIPVIKRSYPLDKTPCLTIDDSGGSTTLSKYYTNLHLPSPNHTNTDNDDDVVVEYVPQQVLVDKRQSTIQLNVWCDTENEREHINNQITTLFYKVQSDNYYFCKQYTKEGICSTTNTPCYAINDNGKRGIKNQCPQPSEYGYCNLFTKHHIIRPSFNIEAPFTLDDLTTEEVVLRSIFKISMTYYDYYTIGGNLINDLIISDNL